MIFEVKQAPEALPKDNGARVYKWVKDGVVWWSAARKGNGITIHVMAEGRKAKLSLRESAEEFIDYLFKTYRWCELIFCITDLKTTYNLSKKCGFVDLCDVGPEHNSGGLNLKVTVRPRHDLKNI